MVKYILVGGKIYKAPDGGKAFCEELIKDINHRPVKILDCLFAREKDAWENKFSDDQAFFAKNIQDFEIELALPDRFIEQVKNSDVIFFQGGMPKLLMSQLDPSRDWAKELDGKILVGSSGGADTIVKYYGVGKTSAIGEGLGLLPIKFIPHWKSEYYGQDIVVDWDGLLEKLKTHEEQLETIVLQDGEFKVYEQDSVVHSQL